MINWDNRTTALRERLEKLLHQNFNGVVLQLAGVLEVNPKILKSFIHSGVDGNDKYQITAKTYNQIVRALSKASILFVEADFTFIVESISRSPKTPDLTYPVTFDDDEIERIVLMHYFFLGGEEKKLKSECSRYSELKKITLNKRVVGLVEAVKTPYTDPLERLKKLKVYRQVLDDIKASNSISIFSVNMDEYLWNEKNEFHSHFYLSVLNWWHSIKDKKLSELHEEDIQMANKYRYDIEKKGFLATLKKEPAFMVESKRP
tara:strand:+ start:1668 stop:2450 length:783 start_codon:yes stop_codon:yes gene_type:complete